MEANQTVKVLVSDPLADSGIELLQNAGVIVDVLTNLAAEELISIIGDYDALIIRSGTQVTSDVIAAANRLRVIARAGVGVDNVDIMAATHRGIIVVNAPTGNVAAAAEHAIALLMSLARNISAASDSMQRGEWNRKAFMGVEVSDKTLGTLGLGRVATNVVRRAIGLGMQVIAYDPYVSGEYAANLGVEMVELEQLMAQSDFITVHLPLNDQTQHMINADRLALCKPGVRIINTARGGVIEEAALLEALDSERVAGAALDVFSQEPLAAGSPLRHHPRLLVTPHIGGSTSEAQDQVAIDVASQVVDVLADRPARYAVNAPLIPSSDIEFITPFISLVDVLGRFLMQFEPSHVEGVELVVHGPIADYDTKILQAAALRGLLADVVEERVNVVNADLIAQRRGIIVSERRQLHHHERFENMITLKVLADDRERSVRGSVLHGRPYVVAIEDLWVDFLAEGNFLLSWHFDRPGVIGAIGTLLGENDINIAFMHVGRRSPRGKAIMVINTDEPVPEKILPAINDIIATHKARTILL